MEWMSTRGFRAMDDTQLLRNPCPLGCRRAAQTSLRLALPKRFHPLFLQPSARVGIDAGENSLVADALAGIVRVHVARLGSNQLGRPAIQHQVITDELRALAVLDHATVREYFRLFRLWPVNPCCNDQCQKSAHITPWCAFISGSTSAIVVGCACLRAVGIRPAGP